MKNEIMVRAISGIDDDLIADAHAATRKPRLPMQRLAAMAACMLLFFGTLIYLRLPGSTIRFDGSALSGAPVLVQDVAPAVHTAELHMRDSSALTVTLDLRLRDATRIVSADSTFELLRGEETLYTGSDHTASGHLTLAWSVRTPDPSRTYQLAIGEQTCTLAFDTTVGGWCIQTN